jgi:hypothetical protein
MTKLEELKAALDAADDRANAAHATEVAAYVAWEAADEAWDDTLDAQHVAFVAYQDELKKQENSYD